MDFGHHGKWSFYFGGYNYGIHLLAGSFFQVLYSSTNRQWAQTTIYASLLISTFIMNILPSNDLWLVTIFFLSFIIIILFFFFSFDFILLHALFFFSLGFIIWTFIYFNYFAVQWAFGSCLRTLNFVCPVSCGRAHALQTGYMIDTLFIFSLILFILLILFSMYFICIN